MLKTFRKTATIQAEQFLDPKNPPEGVVEFYDAPLDQTVWFIRTLEGHMNVSIGDWVARGVKGEFWPIKPDIFAQTYEEVP